MLAPRGDHYVIENLFQGYVEKDVLDQALFDLTSVDVRGSSSDADLSLDRVELTESGGGSIEYFTVTNKGNKEVNLKGFSLRAVDPRSGEVNDRSAGVRMDQNISVAAGESVSVGRTPDIVDADGNQVAGAFARGGLLALKAGDQAALLGTAGAVVDTISI